MPVAGKSTVEKAAAKRAATKKPAPKKAPAKKAPAKKPAAKRNPNPAISKAMRPGRVGSDKTTPLSEVTKKIWNYVKKNQPRESGNKRQILPATLEPQFLTHAQIEMMVKSARKP